MSNAARKFSWPGLLMGLAAVALAVMTVVVGVHTPSNPLATTLLQAATFIAGVAAAYIFAKDSVSAAARELVRPHARSAFRRQRSLYQGLGRLLDEIDRQVSNKGDTEGLWIVRAMIVEQLGMSGDALEDWRDLVPDEVEKLERELKNRLKGEGS